MCGYANVPGEMFCQNCGVQLAPVASTPPPPPAPVLPPASAGVIAPTPTASPPAIPATPVEPGLAGEACPTCGYVNIPGDQFCQNCGLQLAAVRPVSAPAAPPAVSAPMVAAAQAAAPASEAAPPPPGVPAADSLPAIGEKKTAELPMIREIPPSAAPAEAKPVVFITGKLLIRAAKTEIELPPDKNELTIGRADPVRGVFPDIDLTTAGGDTSGVSRLHARFSMQDGQICIEDLNSTNFSFLNRQRLQPGQRYPIKHHDEIRLGLLILEYRQHD